MISLFRFLVFGAIAVALLVFVGVPLIAGPIVGSMVRDAGFPGQDLHVDVNLVGAGILSGHAASIHVQARNVSVPRGNVGDMDLTLHDVSAVDHSFSAVSGTLHNVTVNGPSGIPVIVNTVDFDGPATNTQAHGTIVAQDAERLVSAAAAAAGVSVDSVKLGHGDLTISIGGKTSDAHLRVAGHALILDQSSGSTVLVAPAPSENWRLEGVSITPGSIQVDLQVDVRALAGLLPSGGHSVPKVAATPAP